MSCNKNYYSSEEVARAVGSHCCAVHDHHFLWVYRCADCGKWHLTRNPNNSAPVTAETTYHNLIHPFQRRFMRVVNYTF
jgi:hypothetical protein